MNKALLPPQFADAEVSPASCWPGFDFLQIFEHPPVVSCDDAAAARGVPLSVELKTLVVRAKDMFFAVHLPGDKRLNSRAVKKALGRGAFGSHLQTSWQTLVCALDWSIQEIRFSALANWSAPRCCPNRL